MAFDFNGKTVAFMVAAGFHETEFTTLQRALVQAGAKLLTLAPEQGVVNGWQDAEGENTAGSWGHYFPVDQQLAMTLAADLDILVVPGGEKAIAKLGQNLHARRILTHAIDGLVPVAVFGEAQTLLESTGTPHTNLLTVTDLGDESWTDKVLTHLSRDFHGEEELRAAA